MRDNKYQRAYIERLKSDPVKWEAYKEKERARGKRRTASMQRTDETRRRDRLKQQSYRIRKRQSLTQTKKTITAKPFTSSRPDDSGPDWLEKALARVRRALPKCPYKQAVIVRALFHQYCSDLRTPAIDRAMNKRCSELARAVSLAKKKKKK